MQKLILEEMADFFEMSKADVKKASVLLVKIMEWVEISEEELAEKSRLSDRTIRRLLTQDGYNVNLKTVVAICIGMHLPPLVSRHLIESAGLSFKYANKEYMLYDFSLPHTIAILLMNVTKCSMHKG